MTGKNNLINNKTKTNNPKTSNDLDVSSKDSNEEANSLSSQIKKSTKNEQSSRAHQKHKISNMFKKLNKKTSNNQQEDFDKAFEKIANLKKIPNYKRANAGENNDFQFHDMEEIAINHNSDNKENYKKEIDSNFKSYTQNILLKTGEASHSQAKSVPVYIEVLTSKWCEKISRKVI